MKKGNKMREMTEQEAKEQRKMQDFCLRTAASIDFIAGNLAGCANELEAAKARGKKVFGVAEKNINEAHYALCSARNLLRALADINAGERPPAASAPAGDVSGAVHALYSAIEQRLPHGRARALALTKLEECKLWAQEAAKNIIDAGGPESADYIDYKAAGR